MPSATIEFGKQRKELNARPDRLDLRDRPYRPPLRPIRPRFPRKEHIQIFLPLYEDLILDQGKEGACTAGESGDFFTQQSPVLGSPHPMPPYVA